MKTFSFDQILAAVALDQAAATTLELAGRVADLAGGGIYVVHYTSKPVNRERLGRVLESVFRAELATAHGVHTAPS